MTEPILEFEDVSYCAEPPFDVGMAGCCFTVRAGGLVAVRTEKGVVHSPLGALALGLRVPQGGCVRFMGKDWRQLSPDEAAAMRGWIGRVFAEDGWVSNLDVDENIMLAQLHHTRRRREEVRAEAVEWARRFGLADIPTLRVHLVKRSDLRVLEWVRAFLGEKKFVLLENPMNNVPPDTLEALLKETRRLRERGAGFLWLAQGDIEWRAVTKEADAAYEWKGQQWMEAGGR